MEFLKQLLPSLEITVGSDQSHMDPGSISGMSEGEGSIIATGEDYTTELTYLLFPGMNDFEDEGCEPCDGDDGCEATIARVSVFRMRVVIGMELVVPDVKIANPVMVLMVVGCIIVKVIVLIRDVNGLAGKTGQDVVEMIMAQELTTTISSLSPLQI